MKLLKQFNLYEIKGQAFCDSLMIAKTFEKEHKNIVATIEGETRDGRHVDGLSDSIIHLAGNPAQYFLESTHKDVSGKRNKKYLLTRDGFTLLAMGFTGAKALKFKLDYINRFNQMEQFIKTLATTRKEFPEFTSAIKQAHKKPHVFNFINEINMIYRIVTDKTAREYRESYNLPTGEVIKPYLSLEQIKAVESLQRVDIGLIEAGLTFKQRREKLTELYAREYQKDMKKAHA